MVDCYEILGVEPDATPSQITKGYRARANRWHPDKWCAEPEADRNAADARFKQVQEAYDQLIDPEKRSLFDEQLAKQAVHTPQAQNTTDPSQVPSYAAEVARELKEALENAANATSENRRRYWTSKAEAWERSLDPIISMISKTVTPGQAKEMDQEAARYKTRSRSRKRRRSRRVVVVLSLVVVAGVVALVLLIQSRRSSPLQDELVSAMHSFTAQTP